MTPPRLINMMRELKVGGWRLNCVEINIKPLLPVVVQCPGETRSPVLVDPAGSSHQRRVRRGVIVFRPKDLIIPGVTLRSSLFRHRRFPRMIFFGELFPAGLNCDCKLKLFFMRHLLLPPTPKKSHSEAAEPTSAARFYEIMKALFLTHGKGTIIFD